MIKDYFLLVFRNFTRRKLRGWLTILGILIGIAAVVALVSVSQGMEGAIKEQFEKMGTNKVIIMPGGKIKGMPAMGSMMMAEPLTEDDAKTIEKAKGVEIVSPVLAKVAQVKFSKETISTFIHAWPMDKSKDIWRDMMEIDSGRDLKAKDKSKVVIGYEVEDLFDKKITLGSKIEIMGEEFEVVGILKKTGGRDDDISVYMDLKTAHELLDTEEITTIYVQIKDGFDTRDAAEDIKKKLRNFRNEKEGEETFQVQTFEQMLDVFGIILDIVRAVLIGIAAISLVVGGIGIMNSMYTAVLERTREIGVMKAIGARNSSIMTIFLLESGFYGLVGGFIGVVFGLAMAKTAEYIVVSSMGVEMFYAATPLWLIIGALAFSFLIGCISGVAPARHASSLNPVDALRYE